MPAQNPEFALGFLVFYGDFFSCKHLDF
jgi:hypothetical protein